MLTPSFWKNKTVLVTGHTGFKGGWLSLWLSTLGAKVVGIALPTNSTPNFFSLCNLEDFLTSYSGDIRDYNALTNLIQTINPDIVFHLAAQSLVLPSYQDPIETYASNVMGTLHTLQASFSHSKTKAFINVTSDKCYQNKEWVWAYREEEPLGGNDPYSSSKACAEILTHSFRHSFLKDTNKTLNSVRAGNCIGGGDWNQNRLIPDLMRAREKQQKAIIRNPNAIRPWQHVLEPLYGYLLLAEKAWQDPLHFNQAWNFGPDYKDTKPVKTLVEYLQKHSRTALKIDFLKETYTTSESQVLRVDNSKVHQLLKWHPRLDLHSTLSWVLEWYESYFERKNLTDFSLQQIEKYTALVNQSVECSA